MNFVLIFNSLTQTIYITREKTTICQIILFGYKSQATTVLSLVHKERVGFLPL